MSGLCCQILSLVSADMPTIGRLHLQIECGMLQSYHGEQPSIVGLALHIHVD